LTGLCTCHTIDFLKSFYQVDLYSICSTLFDSCSACFIFALEMQTAIDYNQLYEQQQITIISLRHELEQPKKMIFAARSERFEPADPSVVAGSGCRKTTGNCYMSADQLYPDHR